MSRELSPFSARVNPAAQRPVLFGVTMFFVILGARWLADQLLVAAFHVPPSSDVGGSLAGALGGAVAVVIFARRFGRASV